jgi:hypothetical protein
MRFLSSAFRHLRQLPILSVAWLVLAVAVACTLQNSTPTCGQGQAGCAGACVTHASDPNNCGTCGNVCGVGLKCSLGACKATCDLGLLDCTSACVNPTNDAAHCGNCNVACGAGLSCLNGVCGCPAGSSCGGVGGSPGTGGLGSGGMDVGVGGTGTGAVAGSGGTGGTGTGAVAGSGGAGGGSGGVPPVIGEAGGYLVGGDWKGYVWTGVDEGMVASIDPPNFETILQPPYCVSGVVPPTSDFGAVAIWGWTVNQEAKLMPTDPDPPKATVTPTKMGVMVNVSTTSPAELRVQVQAPAPDETFWCTTLGETGVDTFIPWTDFNTECWQGGDGDTYAMQEIESIMITVPGGGEGEPDVDFDFCVNSLVESDMTGPPPGTSCSLAQIPGSLVYSLTGDDVAYPIRDGHKYVAQNNVWAANDAGQTVTGLGTSFQVTVQSNNMPTNGAPASFPSVFVGSNHGRTSETATLPKQVSAILASAEGVPTAWRWSGSSGGAYNAAYDVWFSTGADGDDETPSGAYMMVWLHSQGVQPLGSDRGQVSVGGKAWKYWYCGSGCQDGVDVATFVPLSSLNEYSFNLKDFIQHAVTSGQLQATWYLTNVFAGFEIWNGGVGLKTDNFCAVVP